MPSVPQLPVSGHISTVKNLHDRMVSFCDELRADKCVKTSLITQGLAHGNLGWRAD
jgi:hypothetical protein